MTATILPFRAQPNEATQPWSDEAVAAACGTGDPRAIAEFFERFQVPVTRFLSRVVGGAEVEDLVQITFLQIARGKCKYEGRSSALTWLFGIASNVLRQHRRATVRRKRLAWALTVLPTTSTVDRTLEQVEARRSMARVESEFAALPESSRVAFVLCELEGLSAREAARVLDTTETAVWKRISDARKALLRTVEGGKP
jgi:RNA polymerase sigma-70 factor (ECF subfamily)